MSKHCSACGRFAHDKLYGACLSCLKSRKRLGSALNDLYTRYHANEFWGREKREVRGIIKAVNTLFYDGDWYCVKWDPITNLRKVLATRERRKYLTGAVIYEIEQLIKEVENG